MLIKGYKIYFKLNLFIQKYNSYQPRLIIFKTISYKLIWKLTTTVYVNYFYHGT